MEIGGYKVLLDAPLPQLDLPSAHAYEALLAGDDTKAVYALVCNDLFPFRGKLAQKLIMMKSDAILNLLFFATAYIPKLKQKRMVLIYEKPLGGRVVNDLLLGGPKFTFLELTEKILQPLHSFLSTLAESGLTHRSIRPNNLYYRDEAKTKIVLGDALSSPPALFQPDFFETIPSAMCLPMGRGAGTIANDVFSLGAIALYFSLGSYPVSYKDDADEMLKSRIKDGSYLTFTYRNKILSSFVPFLKETLNDNPYSLWSLEKFDEVMQGRDISPRDVGVPDVALKSFTFNGEPYFSLRELCQAFLNNQDKAAKAMNSDEFMHWLRRGFNDQTVFETFLAIKTSLLTASYDDLSRRQLLLYKTCMLLDKTAPIRYKDISFMPDAFGTMLAYAIQNNQDLSVFQEIVVRGILKSWIGDANEEKERQLYQVYSSLPLDMESNDWGKGIERFLYIFAPTCPCLSPLLTTEYVEDVHDLLPALERSATQENTQLRPIDRHIVAFIITKMSSYDVVAVSNLMSRKKYIFVEAMIALYSNLQKKLGPNSLPKLASWVGGFITPVINSYHNRDTKNTLEKDIPRFIRKGDFIGLSVYISDPNLRAEDTKGFLDAVRRYVFFTKTLKMLEGKKKMVEKFSLTLGHQIATILSVSVATIFIFITLVLRLL